MSAYVVKDGPWRGTKARYDPRPDVGPTDALPYVVTTWWGGFRVTPDEVRQATDIPAPACRACGSTDVSTPATGESA